jgi:hypothetical protein
LENLLPGDKQGKRQDRQSWVRSNSAQKRLSLAARGGVLASLRRSATESHGLVAEAHGKAPIDGSWAFDDGTGTFELTPFGTSVASVCLTMTRHNDDRIPIQRPNGMTWLYVAFALAVVVLFIWGMITAGSPP